VQAVLIEDSLIYFLPQEDYQQLRSNYRTFDRFFHGQRSRRLFRATRSMVSPDSMLVPITSLMATDLVTTTTGTPVCELAELMSNAGFHRHWSSMTNGWWALLPTGTCVRGSWPPRLPPETPVADIMTPDPEHLSEKATIFDATLLMTRHGMHHLPVVRDEKAVGILTTSDLISARQDDPVYIVQRLTRQESVSSMQAVLRDIPQFCCAGTMPGYPRSRSAISSRRSVMR